MTKKADVLDRPLRRGKPLDDAFNEEIVKTYLRTSAEERPKKKKPLSLTTKISWVVTILATSLALYIFFTNSNIDIKINILRNTPFISKESSVGIRKGMLASGIFFVRGGEPNREVIKKTFFVGDARVYSRLSNNEILLCNAKSEGSASYMIEFREPIDFNGLDLKYTARGEMGDEKLVMIVSDSDNRSFRVDDSSSVRLSGGWQTYTINLMPVKHAIDLTSITSVRFEFGSLTVANRPLATIFLKDVHATKTKRIKWLQ